MPPSDDFKRVPKKSLGSSARRLVEMAYLKRIPVHFGYDTSERLKIRVYTSDGMMELPDSLSRLEATIREKKAVPKGSFERLFFQKGTSSLRSSESLK